MPESQSWPDPETPRDPAAFTNDDIPWVEAVAPTDAVAPYVPFAQSVPADLDQIPFVEPVPKRGWAIPAWILIAVLVGLDLVLARLPEPVDPNQKAAPDIDVYMLKFQGKYIVGAGQMLNMHQRKSLLQSAAEHAHSDEAQLLYAILEGELDSPSAALDSLNGLALPFDDSPETKRLRRLHGILTDLYEDYDAGAWHAPSLTPPDRQYLIDELGWFGRLATAPEKGPNPRQRDDTLADAQATVVGVVGVFIAIAGLGLLGLIGLIIFLIFAGIGKLRGGIRTGSRHGGVYAETFALWMVAFLLLSFVSHWGLKGIVPDDKQMFVGGVIELFSLLVLGWPVLRGVPWSQVRQDIGLNFGRRPFFEPFLGVATYVMSLPLLFIGLLLMFMLRLLGLGGGKLAPFADADGMHPIVFELPNAGNWQIFQVFFLACIVAPIVEEIMFRGVLYRQVREGTSGLGRFGSVFLGAIIVSFVFAVIHPQGFLAVPVLMSLAFGFTLAREWRGTVIPGIVAHGINNGLALSAALWLLRN